MKILVTGCTGQLGRDTVLGLQNKKVQVLAVPRSQLDFSEPERVEKFIARQNADWIINCAAYTDVDKAEEDSNRAFTINRDSARAIAQGASVSGGRLLHVSTDYVFSGDACRPYEESDRAISLGVYGNSKWQGEQEIRAILPAATILRTAWVYGVHGHNFVNTILGLAREREQLRVVDDQIGTPTWTVDIFNAMWALLSVDASGLYHFTNEGVASWYDVAVASIAAARCHGIPVQVKQIVPISGKDYPTSAQRPCYSVLSKNKIRKQLNYNIPHWNTSLNLMIGQLKSR